MKEHNITKKFNKKSIVNIILLLFIGQGLNLFWKHHLFLINQFILLLMLIIQYWVLERITRDNEEIIEIILNSGDLEVYGLFQVKMSKISSSYVIKFISIILIIFYIATMFVVGCLELNITGIYGGILGALVFYHGIQAYIRYLILLYAAYDLRHLKIKNYSFYFPAMTDWIRKLAYEFNYIEKWFLVLGLLYTGVYTINIPQNMLITVNDLFKIHSVKNFLFLFSWIGILLLFVFAFLIFTFASRSFIKTIISNCKYNSISQIEQILQLPSPKLSDKDLELLEHRLTLIQLIINSADYPLKTVQTLVHNMYVILMSIITLISPFLSIFEKILFKV